MLATVDYGHLHVRFLNAGGTSLGRRISTATTTPRNGSNAAGLLYSHRHDAGSKLPFTPRRKPSGPTDTLILSMFQVTQAQNELMYLEVNTTNGR